MFPYIGGPQQLQGHFRERGRALLAEVVREHLEAPGAAHLDAARHVDVGDLVQRHAEPEAEVGSEEVGGDLHLGPVFLLDLLEDRVRPLLVLEALVRRLAFHLQDEVLADELPLQAVFEAPTVAQLAATIEGALTVVRIPAAADQPQASNAKLGHDPDGQSAWFVPDPERPGKYRRVASA